MNYSHPVVDDDNDDLASSKGNEAKWKMKQPSDMPTPIFEHGW